MNDPHYHLRDWGSLDKTDKNKTIEMETLVINLIGSPGTGKSTVAAELFSKMKWAGHDVELISEYAKDLVWEERNKTFENGIYIFAKQHHRMFRLKGKVQYIITDCPLILSTFYNKKYGDGSKIFDDFVKEEIHKFKNLNIFLKRTKPYVAKGRNQTEEESDEFAKEMFTMMKDYVDHYMDSERGTTADRILNIIHDLEND